MEKSILDEQVSRIKEMMNISEQFIKRPTTKGIEMPPLTTTPDLTNTTKGIGMPSAGQAPAGESKVYTDFDSVWDYKFENGHWYAKRKDCKWKDITGNKESVNKLDKRYGTKTPTSPAGLKPPVKKRPVAPPPVVPPVNPPAQARSPWPVQEIPPAVADKTRYERVPRPVPGGGGNFGGGGAGNSW